MRAWDEPATQREQDVSSISKKHDSRVGLMKSARRDLSLFVLPPSPSSFLFFSLFKNMKLDGRDGHHEVVVNGLVPEVWPPGGKRHS